ncbi:MAG: hypothetical protein KIS92_11840, partial [Planctomycetota bacterium]|nr:hypothetical protein [Planctomycetota bacterium]
MNSRTAAAVAVAVLALGWGEAGEKAPAPDAGKKDPLRAKIEELLKPLLARPKPKNGADLLAAEQEGQAAAIQVAGLGEQAPAMLLEMAAENVHAVPGQVLARVLATQPKKSGEWIAKIGACMKPGGKGAAYRSLEDVLMDGEYWCFVLHELQDPAAIAHLAPLLQFRSGPVGKVILELSEKKGSLDAIEQYLKDEDSDPRQRAEFA